MALNYNYLDFVDFTRFPYGNFNLFSDFFQQTIIDFDLRMRLFESFRATVKSGLLLLLLQPMRNAHKYKYYCPILLKVFDVIAVLSIVLLCKSRSISPRREAVAAV